MTDSDVSELSKERGKAGKVPPEQEYRLEGLDPVFQVSPEASYWTVCPVLETVRVGCVEERLEGHIDPYPTRDDQPDEFEEELQIIRDRYEMRYEPFDQTGDKPLSLFLIDPRFAQRVPAGAVINQRIQTGRLPIIANGAELATLFEAEPPGVWHQHVLLTLLDMPKNADGTGPLLREAIAPTRLALIQSALHVAIFSALAAVWRYKWRTASVEPVSRRQRPKEADWELPVLFDSELRFDGRGNVRRDLEVPKESPLRTPGTPRHPAYGSGHSTYSRAASRVMACLLPDTWGGLTGLDHEWLQLAENIGQARIWGGVHWRSDHWFGKQIGDVVADLLIEQLNRSEVNPRPSTFERVPTREELDDDAMEKTEVCGDNKFNWCRDAASLRFEENIQGLSG